MRSRAAPENSTVGLVDRPLGHLTSYLAPFEEIISQGITQTLEAVFKLQIARSLSLSPHNYKRSGDGDGLSSSISFRRHITTLSVK
jgi:hypothetical protein